MPFDPILPRDNTRARAAEMRGQFLSLKEIIDAQQDQLTALQEQCDALTSQFATMQNTINNQQATIANLQSQLDSKMSQDDLIEQCAGACRTVQPLDIPISNPPSQEQVQDILDNHNTLVDILARR